MSLAAMEFLLALSALLSAFTGAFTGARTDARLDQAEAQMVAMAQAAAPARVAQERPAQALPSIVAVSGFAPKSLLLPAFAAPLGLVRLIE